MNALFIHANTINTASGVVSVSTVYVLSFKTLQKKNIRAQVYAFIVVFNWYLFMAQNAYCFQDIYLLLEYIKRSNYHFNSSSMAQMIG